MRIRWFVVFEACCIAATLASSSAAQSFYLRDGDTVVMYGDSITAQNLYNQDVELYTVTRFPEMRVRFYGSGIGGDRVSGGIGGSIDERLSRDVFAHKPTVVSIMLGMNDGEYKPGAPKIQEAYTSGFEHIVASIKQNDPGTRLTLLGPSPFDEVTRQAEFAGGYNPVMQHFGELVHDLAAKTGSTYIDLNLPVVKVLQAAQTIDPRMAQLIVPDRVHPEVVAHWAMAEALLKGWNAPALVSSVAIDAREPRSIGAENATVDEVRRDGKTLRWTTMERSLPLAFNRKNALDALLLELTDIEQRLNQEPLRVTGLDKGQYDLAIDESSIGVFTAEQLAAGINLAEYQTPMWHQAQRVGWTLRDRNEAHGVHLQMLVRKVDAGEKQRKPDAMDDFEDFLEVEMYKLAAPMPHTFQLSPVM